MASTVEATMEGKSEEETVFPSGQTSLLPYKPIPYKMVIVPHKLVALLLFHGLALTSLAYYRQFKWQTHAFASITVLLTAIGILVGAHRLWAHRTFTANLGLRLFLTFFFTLSFEESVYQWVRDHRCHHKWTDSDADPYNARRGFLFSHIGWIFLQRHPEVLRKGKTIDMSDIEGDPILAFQRRWYFALLFLIWGLLPVYIPVYCWGESLLNAFLINITRTVLLHHGSWLVNSWAHLYGSQPYDKRVTPVEATIRHLMLGEGFHNYHHAFPWDYSASELGPRHVFNPATAFIDFCHYMGWATNLKRASESLISKKVNSVGGNELTIKSNFAQEWLGGIGAYLAFFHLIPLGLSYSIKYALQAN